MGANETNETPIAAVYPLSAAGEPACSSCPDPQQDEPASLSLLLPWPLSTNKLWRAVRMGKSRIGNILSKEAREWKFAAAVMVEQQSPRLIRGPVEIVVELAAPTKRAFDLDNRLKIILDLLVASMIIQADDNRIVKKITVGLGEGFIGALVTVKAWEGR